MNTPQKDQNADAVDIRLWKSRIDAFDDVIFLMNQSHDFEITEEWLRCKLSWADGGFATIAYSGEIPVGLALLGYAPYTVNGDTATVMLSLDNFVVKEYRGRGIYRQLLSRLNEACDEEGVDIVLTFPNSQSRPGFQNAGWKQLSPMWAYIHIPLTINLLKGLRRIKKIFRARNANFETVRTRGISQLDLESLVARAGAVTGGRLQFENSIQTFEYRFNHLRGAGYSAVHGKGCSAVVRVGRRGELSEVQIMATFPRGIGSSSNSRELLSAVVYKFNPDIISYLSNNKLPWVASLFHGYIRAKKVTTPFLRYSEKKTGKISAILSGIDLHLW